MKYALKMIEKAKLLDERSKGKVENELQLHKSLKHKNIVQFEHFFEDSANIYILLELCNKLSL